MFTQVLFMKPILILALSLLSIQASAQEYTFGPDSQRQPGVPKGLVTPHKWTSKLYPGTVRDYWIYIPSQYKADKPTPVMIFQDGGGYIGETGQSRIPIVFDNLIHKGDMPVTIGIFVNPGIMPATSDQAQGRYNRSYEYDAVSDLYARFLIEEIIPEVRKSYNLSKDPNDYALAGGSSGGIAAFVAAWQRPDAFRRVLSFIGSYTNLRGGHVLSSMIRKTEPKPLRVYLQDGSNDQNIYGGNWFIGNQDMFSALKYAGYDATFTVGTEGHNMKQGGAIMPDALRWLWRDYPKPIERSKVAAPRQYVMEIIDPAKDWELVSSGHEFTEGPAVNQQGEVYFTDLRKSKIHKIALDGKVTLFKDDTGGANGLKFGPDGRLYACQNGRKKIVAYDMAGKESVIADGVNSNDLVINAKGEIYFTDPGNKRVWFIDAKGAKRVVHEGIPFPNGIQLTPDQSILNVVDMRGKWVWSFQVQPNGSLANGMPFHHLETADESSESKGDGMTMDTEAHLYVATDLGVQVCDAPGRVVAIINKPQAGWLSNVVFGGPDMKTLYVTSTDKVFKRAMKRQGTAAWTLMKPPQPRL